MADPAGFVEYPGLMVIDEIQRVPELLLAIKEQVDADPRPGRYLLTGSARVLGLRVVAPPQGVVAIPFSRYGLSRNTRRFHQWRPGRRVLCTIRQHSLFLCCAAPSGISDCGQDVLYDRIRRGHV